MSFHHRAARDSAVGGQRPGQRGFVLIVVLWGIGLLALLATQVIQAGRSSTQSATALRDHAVAMSAADGGIQQGIFWLLRTAEVPVVIDLPGSIGPIRLRVTIENQAGKINPNLAQASLMRALLVALGEDNRTAGAIADAIVDWRTPAPLSAGGGLKTDSYKIAGLAYGPAGRMFHSIDELALIPGVSLQVLPRLRPHLCIYLDNAVVASAAVGPVARAVANDGAEDVAFATEERVFMIKATATGPGRSKFTRAAIVRLRPGESGLPQILTWESE